MDNDAHGRASVDIVSPPVPGVMPQAILGGMEQAHVATRSQHRSMHLVKHGKQYPHLF